MARQVLPIVGAVAGFVIGGPAGAQAGFAIGSLIGNAVDPLEVQGNKVGDNPLQTAAEGGARAIVYGKGCIRSTCILERGNRIVRKQRDQSGKGGGPVTINERVFWTFAIGLGEDLIGGSILRIWEGEKLVYDVTPNSPIPEETAQFAEKFRFYDGSETQLPDPDLETIHGVGEAPYYRGTAYVVLPNYDLTDYREAIPVFRWEVSKTAGIIDPIAASIWDKLVEWFDCDITGGGMSGRHAGTILEVTESGAGPFGQSNITGAIGDAVTFSGASTSNGDIGSAFTNDYTSALELPGPRASMMAVARDRGTTPFTGPGRNLCGLKTPSTIVNNSAGSIFLLTLNSERNWGFTKSISSAGSVTSEVGPATGGWDMLIFRRDSLASASPDGFFNNVRSPDCGYIGGFPDGDASASVGACRGLAVGTEISGALIDGVDVDEFAWFDDLLTDQECDWLYNSGAFRSYDDLKNFSGHGTSSSTSAPIPLSSIVSDIHLRCGHISSDYDVSSLTDELAGAVYEQSITGAECINSVIGGYFADPSDYDKKIHYIKRGAPVIRTLSYDDLINLPDTTQRENTIEYPKKLHFFFQSSISAYAATKATSSRSSPDYNVKGEVSVATPVTFNDADEPARISAKLHKVNWTDAEGEIEWEVSDAHIDLVPTDCVGISLRGVTRRARITKIMDENGWRKLTMRVDRQSAYTSDVTGIPLPLPTPPQPSILSPTINAYMDIPALRDSDDGSAAVYYDGMTGQTDVWPGATLQRSLDGGSNYVNVTATTINAIMGVLKNTVSDASQYYTDNTNEVVVQLYMEDDIESISNVAFLNEQGAFALSWEDSGVRHWEIMQYRDAHQNSSGYWVLSTLHRGRLNSETAEHPPGSTFVLLDTSVRVINAQSSWIGNDLTHRAVTNGLSPETAASETEPFTALSQTEWPVSHIFLDHDGDDLNIEIVPRHRFGTALDPIRSINWTGYRVTATDGSTTQTEDTTSDILAIDVTGWASPITVTVSQLNRITGPGPSVSETTP